jgi:hypothetical protein
MKIENNITPCGLFICPVINTLSAKRESFRVLLNPSHHEVIHSGVKIEMLRMNTENFLFLITRDV